MSDDSEISKLMSGLLDGGLTPSQLARALRLASEDEAAGKRLVDLLALRSALPAIIAEAAETEKPECLRVRGLFASYRDGDADPADVGLLSRHLDDCLPCALAYDVVQAEADGTLDPLTDEDDDADDDDFDDFDDGELDDVVASAERPEARRRPVRKLSAAALCVAALVAVAAFVLMRRDPAPPAAPAPTATAPATTATATVSPPPAETRPTDSRAARRVALDEPFDARPHLPGAAEAEALEKAVAELRAVATPAQAVEILGAATPERLLAVLVARFDRGLPAAERVKWTLAAANADPRLRTRAYESASVAADADAAIAERAAVRELLAGETAASVAAANALARGAAPPSAELCAAFAATLRRADACRPKDLQRLLLTLGRYCRSDPQVGSAIARTAENAAVDAVGATAAYVAAEAQFDREDLASVAAALERSLQFLGSRNREATDIATAAVRTFGDPEWIQRRALEESLRVPESELLELWPTVDPGRRPERL